MACLLEFAPFGSLRAQTIPTVNLPKPDADGWIRIFRGNNQSDFAVYTSGGAPGKEAVAFGAPFYVQSGDTLRTTGSPNGQLIFKQNFSHYIAEVQLRWPKGIYNTGMLTKVQWNDNGQGGGLPTSVECQGDPNQGIGQVWCLGPESARPWITFHGKTVSNGAQVDSTKPEIDFGGTGANCIVGIPGWQQPHPSAVDNGGWVTIRVESHGKDTTRHFVDDIKVMQYRNPRIAKQNNANDIVKYLSEGMLCVQSEGGEVWYRNWRIKLLPDDPLYASLYSSTFLFQSARPVLKAPESVQMRFNGGALTIFSEGIPVSDMRGRQALSKGANLFILRAP